MGENLPKLNDDAGISINIKWLIQIVILVGSAVLLYTHLEGRITDTENEIQGLRYNQNTYVFPDIRVLEGEILEVKLERERVRKDLKRINEIMKMRKYIDLVVFKYIELKLWLHEKKNGSTWNKFQFGLFWML